MLTEGEAFKLPFYVGVGLRVWSWDDRYEDNGTVIGVRAPLGIAFDFNDIPLDIFLQQRSSPTSSSTSTTATASAFTSKDRSARGSGSTD
ncbi:MAG: hypothetical protein WKG01_36655 [Kofleriaceae bacterium]